MTVQEEEQQQQQAPAAEEEQQQQQVQATGDAATGGEQASARGVGGGLLLLPRLHTPHALAAAQTLHILCAREHARQVRPHTRATHQARAQVVTPWDVAGGTDGKIDYDKLVQQVGGWDWWVEGGWGRGGNLCPFARRPPSKHAHWDPHTHPPRPPRPPPTQFGCQWIKEDLISRVERLTGRAAHPFLKRGIFFAHR